MQKHLKKHLCSFTKENHNLLAKMAYTFPCIVGENVACVNQRTFSCAIPSPKDPYTQPSPTKKSR